jgi:predicted heme/steroid binding protein
MFELMANIVLILINGIILKMALLDGLGIYIENHHALLITILFGVCGLGLVIWFITSLAA